MSIFSLRATQKEIRVVLDRDLAARGLVRRRVDEYLWPLADGFEGWFGPTFTPRPEFGRIEAMPQIGVRCAAVEEVVVALGGDGAPRPWLSTMVTQLWNLMPGGATWLGAVAFEPEGPIEEPAQALIDAFESAGRPWAQERSTLAAAQAALSAVRGLAPAVACRGIAATLLMGDRQAAERQLAAAREEAHSRLYDPAGVRAIVDSWVTNFEAAAAQASKTSAR